jgi:hypothetical protein
LQPGKRSVIAAKAQNGERLALLDASAAVFAHEVGNPLQSILGNLESGETEFKKRRIAFSSQRALENRIRLGRTNERTFAGNPQSLPIHCREALTTPCSDLSSYAHALKTIGGLCAADQPVAGNGFYDEGRRPS